MREYREALGPAKIKVCHCRACRYARSKRSRKTIKKLKRLFNKRVRNGAHAGQYINHFWA